MELAHRYHEALVSRTHSDLARDDQVEVLARYASSIDDWVVHALNDVLKLCGSVTEAKWSLCNDCLVLHLPLNLLLIAHLKVDIRSFDSVLVLLPNLRWVNRAWNKLEANVTIMFRFVLFLNLVQVFLFGLINL